MSFNVSRQLDSVTNTCHHVAFEVFDEAKHVTISLDGSRVGGEDLVVAAIIGHRLRCCFVVGIASGVFPYCSISCLGWQVVNMFYDCKHYYGNGRNRAIHCVNNVAALRFSELSECIRMKMKSFSCVITLKKCRHVSLIFI